MRTATSIFLMREAYEDPSLSKTFDHPVHEVVREVLTWVLGEMSNDELHDAVEHAYECVEDDKAIHEIEGGKRALDLAGRLTEAIRAKS